MKMKLSVAIMLLLAFSPVTQMKAQAQQKEVVVVMKQNYKYDDPRWDMSVQLDKGEAITVMDVGGTSYEYWPYPAADVSVPKNVTRLPGGAGEHYIIINGTNVRFRKGPSIRHGYYCYNAINTASVYHNQFVTDSRKPKTDDWGLEAEWKPYYLPKGTRLPYLGKKNGFYKTKFNGQVFYISAQFCRLK